MNCQYICMYDKLKIVDFFCFYIEIDNGIFFPTRLVKVGSADPGTVERLVKAIDLNTEA